MICYGKPALIDQLPPARGVVQASAGTGKTFTLERMVVDFLLTGTPLDQILVVTFTEKAALELRARIRRMLETLVDLKETPAGAKAPLWTLGEAERGLLQTALRSFDRATIATIHGFCRKILLESAFEGGTLLSQELTDGRKLFLRAFRDRVRLRFKDTPGAWPLLLEALQTLTVEGVGDLLLEAGQDRGVQQPPFRDLTADLAAFDPAWLADAAALEQAMITAKVPGNSRKAALERLPGLARLLDRTRSPFTFLGACDIEPLRKACLKLPPGPGHDLGLWLDRVAPARHGLTDKAILVHRLLPSVQARVRAFKNAEGLFDHDDTILQVQAALASPAAATLLQRIAEQYRIALIDEFQDTDQAQWEIFHRLFTGAGQRFYVIGDPKQAIYGFRGGDLPTYEAAVRTLLGSGEPLELTANFRSTPGLIEACNLLFTGGAGDERFFQDPGTYPPDKAVQCGNKTLRATTAAGLELAPVRILVTPRFEGRGAAETLADALALELKEAVTGHGVVLHEAEAVRALHYGDVQVLVGTTREGRLMAKALARIGVPSTFFKQKGLFESGEARDLLDVLRAVERPMDPGRRARALLTPFFGHRLQDLDRIGALPDDHPAVQRLQAWHRLGDQRHFHLLLESLLTDSGLILRLRLRTGSERALTNHLHLAELLSNSARHGAADLEGLVRRLDLWVRGLERPTGEDTDLQRVEGQDRTVQILTLHASKGLEAGIVAIFAFSRGRSNPSLHRFHLADGTRAYSIGSAKDGPFEAQIKLEEASEQERLMYVGLTRAKALLILPCAVVPSGSRRPANPQSPYKVVNRRLKPLADQAEPGGALFQTLRPEFPAQRDRATEALALPDWRMPSLPAQAPPDYAAARQRARPSFTTSYTHLERILKQQSAHAESILAEREPDAPEAVASGEGLPRGSQTGQAIHELIEDEDLAEAPAQAFPAWWSSPARKARVRTKLAEHGLEPRWDEKAALMVHAALTVPLPNRDGSAAPLGASEHVLRELAFLARFGATGDFLEGYMDAVYLRDGLTSFLDWKTNTVPPYSPERLAAFFEEHFAIQAKLYTLVLLDHLRLDDEAGYERGFGGIHYVFLRSTPPALHSFRPTWAMIQAWRQDLQALHAKVAHV